MKIFNGIFIVFLALKLTGIGIVATWSWWWIFAPLWMPITLFIVGLVFLAFLPKRLGDKVKKLKL